jgi:8-oxo-dGTP pyrophosphatase MutT (NUDIX family)
MDRKPLPLPQDPNPYRVRSRELLHENPWIRFRMDRIEHRCGGRRDYSVVGFQRTACGVLALDEQDRVVLVGQWRYPLEVYTWEIVEGGGELDESPLEAIRRELAEEAGLEADHWEPLAFFHTSNSCTDEEAFLFLARDLHPAGGGLGPEDTEELACLREPFDACIQRALAGEITDGLTVVALLALQARRSGVAEALDPQVMERFFQRPDRHPSPGRARWGKLDRP